MSAPNILCILLPQVCTRVGPGGPKAGRIGSNSIQFVVVGISLRDPFCIISASDILIIMFHDSMVEAISPSS